MMCTIVHEYMFHGAQGAVKRVFMPIIHAQSTSNN
jgi:hypothetical protein